MPSSSQALYDLAPLLEMMAAGILLAVGPLAWVAWRNRHATPLRRFQALTLLTLFLTFDLVLFGAFTRLTDSGLGCPDWPGCYGQFSPLGAHAEIAAAQSAMPSGPVTIPKAWVEMIHRYLATSVGVLILVLALAAWTGWLLRRRAGPAHQPIHPGWSTFTLFWVCVQGAFGALTVTMKLFPAIVTLHLLGGLTLLALLSWQVVRAAQFSQAQMPVPISPDLRRLLWASLVLLAVQVSLGGWVSTNYAVLACTDFPKCHGRWWPVMDFAQGFGIWRPLGLRSSGELLDFSALTAIHYAHRLMAYLVLGVLGWLAWRLNRVAGLRRSSRWLAALIGLQFATGLSNVVLGWPLLGAVLHTGGAGALVMVLTWALAASRVPAFHTGGSAPKAARTSVSGLHA